MTPDTLDRLESAINALYGIYLALGIILLIQIISFMFMEWLLKKPVTKFTLLLVALGVIQSAQYFFYSAGGFMEWNYIIFPQVTIDQVPANAGRNLIMTVTYNTLAIPTVVLYIYYIYCRSQSLNSVALNVDTRRKIIKYGVNILVTMWSILLVEYYIMDIITYYIFTSQSGLIFDVYKGFKVLIPVTGIAATLMMIVLDLNFQYWFYSFLKDFKKSLGSSETMQRSQNYYIIAEHCLLSTCLSLLSFGFVIARDAVGNRYYELFFEFAKGVGVFGVVTSLILMRFRIEYTKRLDRVNSLPNL